MPGYSATMFFSPHQQSSMPKIKHFIIMIILWSYQFHVHETTPLWNSIWFSWHGNNKKTRRQMEAWLIPMAYQLSLYHVYGLHVLNRDADMIKTNKRNTWHGLCWTNQQHFSVEVEFFSENLLNRGDSHFSHKFLFPFIVMENGHFNWEYQVFERCGNGVIGWEWSNAPVMIPFWRFGEEIELVLRICEIKGTKPSTTGFGWGLAKESEIQC